MRFIWGPMSRYKAAAFSIILFVVLGYSLVFPWNGNAAQLGDQSRTEPLHITVVLERIYLDGEVSQEVVKETCWSKENFWSKYDQWQLIQNNGTKMVFRKQVDDISPLLKANGFFGITKEGVLTIFNGRPDHSRIIQSFFQIDIKKLESKKQEELLQGIPILTKDRYVQVLETFKPYSVKNE
ncbi:BofC C-terminal domain-containing protein [Bacillus sp. BRMEA1]|uniref:intercompartmental signaling factor BofC n=1 Tax=Neobacillus endophyticus TaxID=2738405 RepID=UPI0015632A4D|nr:intercompartmental signaling factor BofC [Neobacillus endophyticus]NRD75970.1 BofC C-terminal domain-containing protein [Neobacillus endophyticus]